MFRGCLIVCWMMIDDILPGVSIFKVVWQEKVLYAPNESIERPCQLSLFSLLLF